MAYFNHAFRKTFIIGTDSVISAAGTGSQELATSGVGPQFAVLDADTYLSVASGDIDAQSYLMFAQSSFHDADTIGNNPGHGGYMESTKSKGIQPKYVTKMWTAPCCDTTQATTEVCVASDCAPCGSLLYLRMDVKGSPALRFLNHNSYAIGDSSGDSAANGGPLPGLCCATDQTHLDPALAIAGAAQMLLADPLITPFAQECQSGGTLHGVTITNTAGGLLGIDTIAVGGAGGLLYEVGDFVSIDNGVGGVAEVATTNIVTGEVLTVTLVAAGSAYSTVANETTTVLTGSGNGALTVDITEDANTGTFSITDVLNDTAVYTPSVDPVADGVAACVCFVGAYVETKFGDCSFDTRDHYNKEPVQLELSLLNETGDPCNDCGTTTNYPGCMGQTQGETVLREILMTEQYMQNPYNQGNADSARIREIEGSDDVLANVNRLINYKQYNLLHSVPRFNNPTGVFDNDQYLYTIYVECDDTASQDDLQALLDAIAVAADITIDVGICSA